MPFHADLRPKKVDRFIKKYFKRKGISFNPTMDRRQLNLAAPRVGHSRSPHAVVGGSYCSQRSDNRFRPICSYRVRSPGNLACGKCFFLLPV